MSFPFDVATLSAISRLLTFYNGLSFNAGSNPGGMAAGGHRINFIPSVQDVSVVGASVADAANAAQTSATSAAASATTASNLVAALSGTSATSLTIGNGAQALSTQIGKSFDVGTFVGLFSAASPTTHYMIGQVTAYNSVSGALTVNVTVTSGSGARADWALYGRSGLPGVQGVPGATGSQGETAGLKWVFSSTTSDADPGAGTFRFNNATLASVTQIYLDNLDSSGATATTFLDAMDDSTTQSIKGTVFLQQVGSSSVFAIFSIAGSPNVVVDGTGYRKVPVTHVASNGAFANGATYAVTFVRTGDAGSDGAGAGDTISDIGVVVSGKVAVYNGTTGKHITDGGKGIGTSGANLGALDTANTYSAAQSVAATLDAQQQFRLSGDITPSQITSNQDDYAPTGHGTAAVFRLSTDASRNITGVQSGADGRLLILINVGSFNIVLINDATSTAGNRFLLGADYTLAAGKSIALIYDATAARWRPLESAGDVISTKNLSDIAVKYSAYDNLSVHGADVASSGTINLETATGNVVDVTGTTTITAITLSDGHERTVRFTGVLTLTHGASLVLPNNGGNIITSAGDYGIFRGYAAGVVRCVDYVRASGMPIVFPPIVANGRLTLTSGIAVTESDVSGVTTAYFTPYNGATIPLLVAGDVPVYYGFSELSNDGTQSSSGKSGPAALAANSCYFYMVWDDAGTRRLTRSFPWTSDTNVGVNSEIEFVNGLWVNKQPITNGPAARRGTIVGGARTNASSQLVDSIAFRWCSNVFNPVPRAMRAVETTASYGYTTDSYRLANNSTVNRLDWFHALGGGMFDARAFNLVNNDTGGITAFCALGLDSNTVALSMGASFAHIPAALAGFLQTVPAHYAGTAGQGRHFLSRLERSSATGTTTWFGNNASTGQGSNIIGTVWN